MATTEKDPTYLSENLALGNEDSTCHNSDPEQPNK